MKREMFEEDPHGEVERRLLTGALAVLIGALLLRVAGQCWGPDWLPLDRYDILLPAALVVTLWRFLAARSLRISRRAATWWLLVVIAGVTILFFQPHIDSDGDYYYAYLRSILWDGDFNLSNEASWYAKGWMKGLQASLNPTTGYIFSAHTVGPALFWFPFVCIAHLVALALQAMGYAVAANGYDLVYKCAVSLGTWTFVLCGLLVCVRLLETWFDRAAALVATLGMLLASPLLCYGFHSGSFSHGLSFFTTALGLFVWIKQRERPSITSAFRAGFLFGLACLIRPQNALWLALPCIDRALQGGLSRDWKRKILWLIWLAGSAGVAFSPQLILWCFERRSVLTVPQGPGFLDAHRWNQWRVLFDPFHGLFIWHPLHLVGLVGLLGFSKRNRRLGLLFLFGFVLQVWVNGAAKDWWAGGAFGLRRFGSCLPVFMIGLGYLAQRACGDRSLWALTTTGISLFVLWNILLLAQVVEGPLYYNNPMDLGTIWSTQFSIAPTRLELWASRAPLVRWLWIGLADGQWNRFAAWLGLVSVLISLGIAVLWRTPRLLASLLSPRRGATALWIGVVMAPCAWAILVAVAGVTAKRVPVTFQRRGDVLVMRRLALHRPDHYQGGFARFTLGPQEEKGFSLAPPCIGRTLLLIGGQKEGSAPLDSPLLEIRFGSSRVAIPGRLFPPVLPSAAPRSHCPSSAPVIRTEYRGPSGSAPFYSYSCQVPLGATCTVRYLALANLTADVTLAIDGMAILPDPASEPETTELALVGPRKQSEISLAGLTNTDYRHHVFREHDRGRWSFFPLLKEQDYESAGIRFHILPSVDESGEWSVVGILHKGAVVELPISPDCYDGVSFAWVASGTYLPGKGRLPSERLAVVRLQHSDGTVEYHTISSQRNIYDYRDPYVPEDSLVYQEALYQKICRTDFLVDKPEAPLHSVTIEACWQTDGTGIALFAVTAWRKAGE